MKIKTKILERDDIDPMMNKKVYYQSEYSDDYKEYVLNGYIFRKNKETDNRENTVELLDIKSNSVIIVDSRKVLIDCE